MNRTSSEQLLPNRMYEVRALGNRSSTIHVNTAWSGGVDYTKSLWPEPIRGNRLGSAPQAAEDWPPRMGSDHWDPVSHAVHSAPPPTGLFRQALSLDAVMGRQPGLGGWAAVPQSDGVRSGVRAGRPQASSRDSHGPLCRDRRVVGTEQRVRGGCRRARSCARPRWRASRRRWSASSAASACR